MIKHKKFGNKKTRKALRRINLIYQLKKRSIPLAKKIEDSIIEEPTPIIDVESLANSLLSLNTSIAEIPTKHFDSIKEDLDIVHEGKFAMIFFQCLNDNPINAKL